MPWCLPSGVHLISESFGVVVQRQCNGSRFMSSPGVKGPRKGVDPATPMQNQALLGRKPLALILEPARDLAEQTHGFIQKFKKHLPHPGDQPASLSSPHHSS